MKKVWKIVLFFLSLILGFLANYRLRSPNLTFLEEKEAFKNEEITYISGYEVDKNSYTPTNNDPQIDFNYLNRTITTIQIQLEKAAKNNIMVQIFYAVPGNYLQEANSVKGCIYAGTKECFIFLPTNLYQEIRIDINGSFVLDKIYWSEGEIKTGKSIIFWDIVTAILFACIITIFFPWIVTKIGASIQKMHTEWKEEKRGNLGIQMVKYGIPILFGAMSSLLLILLLFFSNVKYICKKEFLLSNLTIFCIGFVVLALISLLCFKILKWDFDKHIGKLSVFLFIVQIYISYNILFYTGWDVGILVSSARIIAYGDISGLNNSYFSVYPNNLLLTTIDAFLLKINHMIGIFEGSHELMTIVLINCAFSSYACFLIYKITKELLNKQAAFAAFLMGIITFGLSPWMVICYSDAFGIIFPILIFSIYLKPAFSKKRGGLFKYGKMILLALFGYMIKPQCLIIMIAVLLVEFLLEIHKINLKRAARILGMACLVLLVFIGVKKVLNTIYEKEGFVINKEATLGWTHFLMMGLNEERNGVWAGADVSFSSSIANAKERKEKNLTVSMERLKQMGPVRYLKHAARKMLATYNDGSYAWGVEGSFYSSYYGEPNSVVAPFLRSIYYAGGSRYQKFLTAAQIFWLMVLTMTFFAVFCLLPEEKKKFSAVLMLSLLGLAMYEILFEVRARYLYTYLPIYCILAGLGIHVFYNRLISNKFK